MGCIALAQDAPHFANEHNIQKGKPAQHRMPSPLVPLKQVPHVNIIRHARRIVIPTVDIDHVAVGPEVLRVVADLPT